MSSLAETTVLVVDVQATMAMPDRGVPLEVGWIATRALDAEGVTPDRVQARLLRLPEGAEVPWTVTRITGIATRDLDGGHDPGAVFGELADATATVAAVAGAASAPAVAHYAAFETRWLDAGLRPSVAEASRVDPVPREPALALACTHAIARRLLPGLPRRGLRALTGYFGRAVGPLRRAADHVAATAFVWAHLVEALAQEGVVTWPELLAWLAGPKVATTRRRVYPMPRALRLSAPDAPGVYRMLRVGGDVLYVGKAVRLRARVNSWFTKQRKIHERSLEMLAQARDLAWTVTETGLEAALLEADEIKELRPPYNVALLREERGLWFASADGCSVAREPDPVHRIGPFTWRGGLDAFSAIVELLADPDAVPSVRQSAQAVGAIAGRGPEGPVFAEGFARFVAAHPEAARRERAGRRAAALLGLAARLWPDFHREVDDGDGDDDDDDAWDAETTAEELEEAVVRAAHLLRRARWIARLSESTVVWREKASTRPEDARLLAISRGDVVERAFVPAGVAPPIPPGHERPPLERIARLDATRLDRLRVLTTELKRVVTEGDAAIALGPGRTLAGPRLARALSWV